MSLDNTISALKSKIGDADQLNKVVRIDLGDDGIITVDGNQSPTTFTATAADTAPDADVTLRMSRSDFESILDGDLNPQMAFMSGKLKVDGDMSVAMKLAQVLG